jgi:hypothetical protein
MWVTYVPALLYSLPLHIAALYLGTYTWLNKIILEGCHDTSRGQLPVCNLSLLPGEQQPPSNSLLNALCTSVNCPCTMLRCDQKKYRNKTCNTTGMSNLYFYKNVHFTIHEWVHVLITMLWTKWWPSGFWHILDKFVPTFRRNFRETVWVRWMPKQMRGKTVDYIGRIKGFWSITATVSGRENRSCTRQVEIESLDWDKWSLLQPQLVRNDITFNMFISGTWSNKPYSCGHQLLK